MLMDRIKPLAYPQCWFTLVQMYIWHKLYKVASTQLHCNIFMSICDRPHYYLSWNICNHCPGELILSLIVIISQNLPSLIFDIVFLLQKCHPSFHFSSNLLANFILQSLILKQFQSMHIDCTKMFPGSMSDLSICRHKYPLLQWIRVQMKYTPI